MHTLKPLSTFLVLLALVRPAFTQEARPLEAIDRHALAAPAEAEASLPALAAYLAKPCQNDREKVRTVYRWVTDRIAYDVEARISGQRIDGSAAAVLQSRRAVCDGYANLVQDLCSRAGVQAV
jgi:transglutaminase-like putative cysteine protease